MMGVTNFKYNTNVSRGSAYIFQLGEGARDGVGPSDFNATWEVTVPLDMKKGDGMWEGVEGGRQGEFGQCLSFNKRYMVVGGEYTTGGDVGLLFLLFRSKIVFLKFDFLR